LPSRTKGRFRRSFICHYIASRRRRSPAGTGPSIADGSEVRVGCDGRCPTPLSLRPSLRGGGAQPGRQAGCDGHTQSDQHPRHLDGSSSLAISYPYQRRLPCPAPSRWRAPAPTRPPPERRRSAICTLPAVPASRPVPVRGSGPSHPRRVHPIPSPCTAIPAPQARIAPAIVR
jgi:hypothetical protein